jgi:hypothetical protein
MKGLFRSKLFLSLAALVMVLLLTVTISQISRAHAASSSHSEQVIFSGTGFGTFGGTATPFGFWIWCEADSGNSYVGQCNGAMYFYALGIVKHVVDGSITELADGVYSINVLSSADTTVNCTLVNGAPPVKGPNNTVTATCTAPATAGVGTSGSAVVNVTGPSGP